MPLALGVQMCILVQTQANASALTMSGQSHSSPQKVIACVFLLQRQSDLFARCYVWRSQGKTPMRMFTLLFNRAIFFSFLSESCGDLLPLGIRSLYLVSGYPPVSSAFCLHYQLNRQDLCRYHSILSSLMIFFDLSLSLPFCM